MQLSGEVTPNRAEASSLNGAGVLVKSRSNRLTSSPFSPHLTGHRRFIAMASVPCASGNRAVVIALLRAPDAKRVCSTSRPQLEDEPSVRSRHAMPSPLVK